MPTCKTTVRGRIWEIVLEHDKNVTDRTSPWELTQDGMAEIIGRSRAQIAIETRKMERDGVVISVYRHVPNSKIRRKVYARPEKVTICKHDIPLMTNKALDDKVLTTIQRVERLERAFKAQGIDIGPLK